MNEIASQAMAAFQERFGGPPEVVVQAPGRVNLIGEHTDYNEGFVFPAAIDRWVVFAARGRAQARARIRSMAHGEEEEFSLDRELSPGKTWGDYPKGVVREFQKLGTPMGGFEAVLAGNVPIGAGLSSSAAVEMAVGRGLLEMNGAAMPGPELALLGQRAENRFVGINCGIMDQFVSANARQDHALFLDCRDLSYELVPLAGEGVRIVICNTNVKRRLASSAYNERRAACEEGARLLAKATGRPIRALRDVSVDDLTAHAGALPPEIQRRCRHVVTENARALRGVAMLKAGDVEGFGSLMAGSHESLREDYEVSGKELDLLVEVARGVPGVLGARMTGAGFGGCTVNLVRDGAVASLIEAIERRYPAETGLRAEVYVCAAVSGVERVL